jgi:hypothetical protein
MEVSSPTYTNTSSGPVFYNDVTSWIDLDIVYGPNEETALLLRTLQDGKMKLGTQVTPPLPIPGLIPPVLLDFLPNLQDVPLYPHLEENRGISGPRLYNPASGDIRAQNSLGMTIMHLWKVRLHNHLADKCLEMYPELGGDDEELYQCARRLNIAIYQRTVYEKLLPLYLGEPIGNGHYRPYLDPAPTPLFEFAAGPLHSMIPDFLPLKFANGSLDERFAGQPPPGEDPIPRGLHAFAGQTFPNIFGSTAFLLSQSGIPNFIGRYATDPYAQIWRSMLLSPALENTHYIRDSLNNIIVGQLGLSIPVSIYYRCKESGCLDYASVREMTLGHKGRIYGRPGCPASYQRNKQRDPLDCFLLITPDRNVARTLRSLFGKVKLMDPAAGMSVEKKFPSSVLGLSQWEIWLDEFTRVRDADRFFWTRWLSDAEKTFISTYDLKKQIEVAFPVELVVPTDPLHTTCGLRDC